MLFRIRSMSSIYSTRKVTILPLVMTYTHYSSSVLENPNSFNFFVEAETPTVRCLYQSKNGFFKLTYSIRILDMYKTFWLTHVDVLS